MNDLMVGDVNKNVLIGKDGYLFLYQGGQRQFDYLTGLLQPTSESVENYHCNLKERKNWCEGLGALYKHVVFPSKPILCREKLPESFSDIYSLFHSYYEDKRNDSLVYPYLDLQGSSSFLTKTDSHYSKLGFYKVYKRIVSDLGFKAYDSDFDFGVKDFSGDLISMLGGGVEESVPTITYKDKTKIKFYSNSSALSGNTNDIAIFSNLNPVYDKRVLIFGDSFFKGMLSFIISIFRDVVYLRSQHLHKEIATMMSPDIILTGNAERYLSKVRLDSSDAGCHIMRLYGDSTYNPHQNFIEAYNAQLSYGFYPDKYEDFYLKMKI